MLPLKSTRGFVLDLKESRPIHVEKDAYQRDCFSGNVPDQEK